MYEINTGENLLVYPPKNIFYSFISGDKIGRVNMSAINLGMLRRSVLNGKLYGYGLI